VDDAVLDLAAVAVVLSLDADGVRTALGDAGLVDAADRIGFGVFVGHNFLAPIAHPLLVPLDAFQKTL